MQLASTHLSEVFENIADPKSDASAVNVDLAMLVPIMLQIEDLTAVKSLHIPNLDSGGNVNTLIPLVISPVVEL